MWGLECQYTCYPGDVLIGWTSAVLVQVTHHYLAIVLETLFECLLKGMDYHAHTLRGDCNQYTVHISLPTMQERLVLAEVVRDGLWWSATPPAH